MSMLAQNTFFQEVLLQVLMTLHAATYPSEILGALWVSNLGGGLAQANQADVHPPPKTKETH